MGPDGIFIVQETDAAAELAARLAAAGRAACERSGRFALAVSPAALSAPLVDALAAAPIGRERFWRATHLFLSDTRGVKPAALRAAVERLPLAHGAAHLEPADHPRPTHAATAYEQELRAFFSLRADALPRFDLVLLELGPDAHAASLFPFSETLDETARLAVASYVRTLGRHCVTFTMPLINHAREILLLAAGAAVAPALGAMTSGAYEPRRLPAQLINPVDGKLHLLADHAAALGLPPARRAARVE